MQEKTLLLSVLSLSPFVSLTFLVCVMRPSGKKLLIHLPWTTNISNMFKISFLDWLQNQARWLSICSYQMRKVYKLFRDILRQPCQCWITLMWRIFSPVSEWSFLYCSLSLPPVPLESTHLSSQSKGKQLDFSSCLLFSRLNEPRSLSVPLVIMHSPTHRELPHTPFCLLTSFLHGQVKSWTLYPPHTLTNAG